MPSSNRDLTNLKISESFYRLMQTDPVDDRTLLDGTGSLVTYLTVSGTVESYYFKGDGSQLTNITASSLPAGIVSSSAQLGLSPSDSPIFNNLTINGTLTAQEIKTEYVSSSIIFESGSTKFGDSLDDKHQFTGSVLVTGSVIATSFVGDGSGLTGIISALPSGLISGSQQISNLGFVSSSDWIDITNKPANLISSSGQRSILGLGESDSPTFANGNYTGNVVIGGTLTARTYVISSSVVNYETILVSGSTKFGDSIDDTHQFTGSLQVSGALVIPTVQTLSPTADVGSIVINNNSLYIYF